MSLRFQVARYAIRKQGIKQLEITFCSTFSLFPMKVARGQAHSSQRESQASSP